NTKIFNYEVQEGEVKIKPGYTPLQLQTHPIAITFAKINDKLVADPWLEEEQVMDARLTITTDDQGRICAVQKGGSGYFTTKQIMEAAQIARDKAQEIRKKLGWVKS
ncbi:MAG: RNA-binding protein, partial [Candidatus Bathyarchaeia archaeon]